MYNFKTAALVALLLFLTASAMAEPSQTETLPQKTDHSCPIGTLDANYPGVPVQCIKCAAPGCPSCHSERTQKTVAATDAAERNCPPVKPH